MNQDRINIALAVLLVVAATFAVAMKADYTVPNVEFLPEMKRSPAFDTFSANPILPNGRTQQRHVTGTIARGQLPLYYAPTKEDAVRAGEELQNPFDAQASAADAAAVDSGIPADGSAVTEPAGQSRKTVDPIAAALASHEASTTRGGKAYAVFCVSCHGAKGAGDGPVAKRGFPPPPPLTTGKSVQMKDGQLFHILTYGQGSMSSMAGQLDRDQRWDVINYVRRLQSSAAVASGGAAIDSSAEVAPPNEALATGATNAAEPVIENDKEVQQ